MGTYEILEVREFEFDCRKPTSVELVPLFVGGAVNVGKALFRPDALSDPELTDIARNTIQGVSVLLETCAMHPVTGDYDEYFYPKIDRKLIAIINASPPNTIRRVASDSSLEVRLPKLNVDLGLPQAWIDANNLPANISKHNKSLNQKIVELIVKHGLDHGILVMLYAGLSVDGILTALGSISNADLREEIKQPLKTNLNQQQNALTEMVNMVPESNPSSGGKVNLRRLHTTLVQSVKCLQTRRSCEYPDEVVKTRMWATPIFEFELYKDWVINDLHRLKLEVRDSNNNRPAYVMEQIS
ncbi:MAG: hypothetical protein M3P33_00920 [bacterium]|nr:hypothetical protein [bacterium]